MDHKSWLWKRKSTEKAIVDVDKSNLSLKGNEEQTLLTDQAELQRDLKILNEKLSSAISDSNAKDDIMKKRTKKAQEATAGWEKAKAEAISLKQELDKAVKQRIASEERTNHLDAALKECMEQLRFVREEQEKRIHDAVMRASREFENTRIVLEEKLAESNKRLGKLVAENSQLSNALLAKEKVIEDLNACRNQAEAESSALMTRLESIEKENSSLNYEVRVLEKELEIRNEEREFNRRTADVAHKQHLESVKKIAKLESECQRLRILVRKRLPGPAALAKMKNEVEMLGRDPGETRRRKSNFSAGSIDFSIDTPGTANKRISFLTEKFCAMEEENKALKESLHQKTNELQLSRVMYARTASKLSQVETQLEDSSKGPNAAEERRNLPTEQELSVTSMSDLGSEEKVSCAESWASALISELEHFRSGKQAAVPPRKGVGASDMNLMDDFIQMEKLAIVSVNEPFVNSHLSPVEHNAIGTPLENHSVGYLESAGGEMAVSDRQSDLFFSNKEIQSKNMSNDKVPSWLDVIVKVVLEQICLTQRSPDELLEDIKVALAYLNRPNLSESGSLNHPDESNVHHVSGNISCKPPEKYSPKVSFDKLSGNSISSAKKSNQQFKSNLSVPVHKIIELIEGISLPSPDYDTQETLAGKDDKLAPYKNSETSTGYMVRVFQWKTQELSSVLQQFVQTCYDLLNGREGVEKFVEELTSVFEWIMNHCFSLQDVSSMRDAIKKHFDWDESRSESELDGGMVNQFLEADKVYIPKEQVSYSPMGSAWNVHNNFSQIEVLQPNAREESKILKNELENMESVKKDLEGRVRSEIDKNESLIIQLHQTEKAIDTLQNKVETLKQSKGMIEDQVKDHKMMNEDLDTQLTVAKAELNEVCQKFSCLEKELEYKNNFCEELETECLDLQRQLESLTKKDVAKYDVGQEEKQLQADWEFTAASEKLAECQETILNLGMQLKALASPGDAALFDKVIFTPADANTTTTTLNKDISRRSSLLDKMLAEDNAESQNLRPPETKKVLHKACSALDLNGAINPSENLLIGNGIKQEDNETGVNSLAMVPTKKKGGSGLLKILLWPQKKSNSKKTPFTHAAY